MGSLQLRLSDFLSLSDLSAHQSLYDLGGEQRSFMCNHSNAAQIRMSVAFRYIHRPPSRGYSSYHQSAADLPKIYHHQEKPEEQETEQLTQEASPPSNILPDPEPPADRAPDKPSIEDSASITWARNSLRPKTTKDHESKIQLSFKYSRKTATLSIVVHRIRNRGGDPQNGAYVKLRLIESLAPNKSFRVSNTKRKTTPQKNGPDPIYEETLTYLLAPHELKMRRLELTLCQEPRLLGPTLVLSRCIIKLNSVQTAVNNGEENPTVTEWYSLPGAELTRSSSFNNLGAMPK